MSDLTDPTGQVPGTSLVASKSRHEKVGDDDAGQRVDNFLIRHCPGVPRSHLYRLIRQGRVLVNGKRVKQTRKLVAGEQVRIPPMEIAPAATVRVPDKLVRAIGQSVLLEHPDFIILNKPPGVAVHGGSGLAFGLIDALRQQQGDENLELSHRLDKATSGCLLVGRNRQVNRQLQSLFRDRQIEKNYLALVDGVWPGNLRTVDAPLLKNAEHAGERRVIVDAEGLSATTHFAIAGSAKEATLLHVKLDTGRTHQIRVHARHAGHCVLGDSRYGDNQRNAYFRRLGLNRLFLHASSLSFDWNGQMISVTAPTDKDWQGAMDALELRHIV